MIEKLKDESFRKRLVHQSLLFAIFFLTIKLFVTGGGIIDYIKTKNLMTQKEHEYQSLLKSNEELAQEIERIKTDKTYQVKILREKLGVIKDDEFLILFAEEYNSPSI